MERMILPNYERLSKGNRKCEVFERGISTTKKLLLNMKRQFKFYKAITRKVHWRN